MPDPPATRVILETPDLRVRAVGDAHGPVCFVTFSPFSHDRTLNRPGFAEAFLASRGVPAIHVISRTNSWFDYPQMDRALALIAEAARGYERVVTYGSSMGGYAAIRFAETVGASAAIAISPQSGLGARAPFEDRFRSETRSGGRARHGSQAVVPHVFYDPHDLDALHVRRILSGYPRTQAIPLPHAGHPAGPYLDEAGLLTGAVLDIAFGRFDPAAFTAQARAARRGSSHYLFTLARRLGPGHAAAKASLTRMAIARRDDPTYRCYLATLLEMQGDVAGAQAQLDRAVDLLPDHPVILFAQATFLLRRGRISEGRALIGRLAAQWPENRRFGFIALLARLPRWLPWRERSYGLDRELRMLDEWRRRKERRRRWGA